MAKTENGLSDAEVFLELLQLIHAYGGLAEIPEQELEPSAKRFAAALKKLKA